MKTSRLRIEDSANYTTYELTTEHGTTFAKVQVPEYGTENRLSPAQVFAAMQLLVPGRTLLLDYRPDNYPHTLQRKAEIDAAVAQDPSLKFYRAPF